METLSKAEEGRITSALERAIDLVNAGSAPNDALHKVAEAERFTPPVIQRMVEAYNVSKTLSHMKHASGADKAKAFPLADAVAIVDRMYPPEVVSPAEKAAALRLPGEYARPEERSFMRSDPAARPLAKAAVERYPRDARIHTHYLCDKRLGLQKRADSARSEYRIKMYDLTAHIQKAASYFKFLDHEPFELVERKAAGEYGKVGRDFMSMVHEAGHMREKRAAQNDKKENDDPWNEFPLVEKHEGEAFMKQTGASQAQALVRARQRMAKQKRQTGYEWKAPTKDASFDEVSRLIFDGAREPYRSIAEGIKAAHELVGLAQAAAQSELAVEEITKEAGLPLSYEREPEPCLLDGALGVASSRPFEKNALLPLSVLSGVAGGALGMAGLIKEDPEAARRKAEMEVYDPIHDAQVRAIQTQSILNDFLSNDPVISGYDPKEVLTAYNQVSQLAPSLSTQPSVMRGLLRRMLQQEGVVEPHEAQQLADLESKLKLMPASP